MSIVGKENKTMNQLLMEGEWNIYYVSALYKFQQDREALTTDAMDLVVFLRTADDRDLKPHQGVSVSVRSNDDMAVFSIQEQVAGTGGASGQSVGAFVYYTPQGREGVPSLCAPQLLLLQGTESLVKKVCGWVQHRYQCVVALQSLRIRSICMEQFAQSLFLHIATESGDGHSNAVHAPLKLTLRREGDVKVVRSITISIPFHDILAKHELERSNIVYNRERRDTLVEQDHMIRSLCLPYFSQLSED
ncbi:hypothetical protein AaE_011832, partial [Aphanomyces astaci]